MSTAATTGAAGDGRGAHKRHVRNYLLDSHFQLKYAGVLVVAAVAVTGVPGIVLYQSTRAVVGESSALVEESKKVSEVSRMGFKDYDSPELMTDFDRAADAHDKAMADERDSLLRRQKWMLVSLVAALVLIALALGALGIYVTHKVAGPVFKMKRLLRQVGEGDRKVEAQLRKGDELKDFFDTFTDMVAGIRRVDETRLAAIDGALAALDRGANEDAARALVEVRDAMKRALDG